MRFKQAVFALLHFIPTLHATAQNPLDLPPCPDADKVHPAQIRTIQGEPVDGHWHEPQTYEVRMYEKTEWSMSLNEKAMMAISNFFRKNGGGKNGLNPYDPDQVDVSINDIQICKAGGIGEDRNLVDMRPREVHIDIELHAGDAEAAVWTNDLTHQYVEENSEYTS
jgi:hypothetical protein